MGSLAISLVLWRFYRFIDDFTGSLMISLVCMKCLGGRINQVFGVTGEL
jgi:hypothetical protein